MLEPKGSKIAIYMQQGSGVGERRTSAGAEIQVGGGASMKEGHLAQVSESDEGEEGAHEAFLILVVHLGALELKQDVEGIWAEQQSSAG